MQVASRTLHGHIVLPAVYSDWKRCKMLELASNDEIRRTFEGEQPGVVYLDYHGRLSSTPVNQLGMCSYFALAHAFDFLLRPETIKVNGKRPPVIEGDDPNEGDFYLLTPKEMEQLRHHHYEDPVIVTGEPKDARDAVWVSLKDHFPAIRIPDVNRHVWTTCSRGICTLQKSRSPWLHDIGEHLNGCMHRMAGRGFQVKA